MSNPVEQVVEARRPVADIVERLRERAKGFVGYAVTHHGFGMTLIEAAEEAANEITTLRSQLAEAREALADVMEDVEMWGVDEYQFASCHRARAILGGEPHDAR